MMIVVNESAAASYLYLIGLTIDEELPLTQHLSLLPATCKASPDDMINSVMKYGSGDETDLGVLIAVLRKTTAQLRVVGEGKELAVRVWNAQSAIVLLSALLNCELIAVWVQLILTQSTAVDGGLGLSILYSLPGLYVILCALPPFYASGESKKAERLITVLIGGAEIVLCGIVLEGSAASYAMTGLMILFCAFEIVSQVRDSRSL